MSLLCRGERGSVSLLAAGILFVLLVCALGLADVGQVIIARVQAQTAADAAALAAVQDLAYPTAVADPIRSATAYAEANGGTLAACTCPPDGSQVLVTVTLAVDALHVIAGPVVVQVQSSAAVVAPTAVPSARPTGARTATDQTPKSQ